MARADRFEALKYVRLLAVSVTYLYTRLYHARYKQYAIPDGKEYCFDGANIYVCHSLIQHNPAVYGN